MDLSKLKEIKQNLLMEKEKQLASLYEIIGALKLLEQQILDAEAEPESNQPSKTEASNQESEKVSSKSKAQPIYLKFPSALCFKKFVR